MRTPNKREDVRTSRTVRSATQQLRGEVCRVQWIFCMLCARKLGEVVGPFWRRRPGEGTEMTVSGDTLLTLRDEALALWEAALAAVHGRRVAYEALQDFSEGASVGLLALGKAAPFLAQGAWEALGARIVAALGVGAAEYAPLWRPPAGWQWYWGDHPVPREASLEAGAALSSFVVRSSPPGGWVVLISGGASSLVEIPAPGVSAADLARANAWLLASGLSIAQVNAVRRRLSRLKGGGLAALLAPGPVWAGYLSDVPGDRLADIASGPLFAERPPLPDGLPPWLTRLCRAAGPPVALPSVSHRLLAGAKEALRAVEEQASGRGWRVYHHARPLTGEAAETGRRLGRWLAEAAPRGVHLWCGETTVRLPPRPGRGGRNQHLALAAALELADQEVVLLAAGSDGRDGTGEHAGACVDGATAARLRAAHLDGAEALHRADSAPVLAAVGDALPARVTGTNVADLLIALRA